MYEEESAYKKNRCPSRLHMQLSLDPALQPPRLRTGKSTYICVSSRLSSSCCLITSSVSASNNYKSDLKARMGKVVGDVTPTNPGTELSPPLGASYPVCVSSIRKQYLPVDSGPSAVDDVDYEAFSMTRLRTLRIGPARYLLLNPAWLCQAKAGDCLPLLQEFKAAIMYPTLTLGYFPNPVQDSCSIGSPADSDQATPDVPREDFKCLSTASRTSHVHFHTPRAHRSFCPLLPFPSHVQMGPALGSNRRLFALSGQSYGPRRGSPV